MAAVNLTMSAEAPAFEAILDEVVALAGCRVVSPEVLGMVDQLLEDSGRCVVLGASQVVGSRLTVEVFPSPELIALRDRLRACEPLPAPPIGR